MATEPANPYRAPAAPLRADRVVINPARSDVYAELDGRGWLYRRIRLGGRVEVDIEWNARGPIETVRVVGRLVASHSPMWYQPRFDFEIGEGDAAIPAVIQVKLSPILPFLVRRFRLEVDGAMVYAEGRAARELAS